MTTPSERLLPTEIEITPAMIEAGVKDYCMWRSEDEPDEIVRSIFISMVEFSPIFHKPRV